MKIIFEGELPKDEEFFYKISSEYFLGCQVEFSIHNKTYTSVVTDFMYEKGYSDGQFISFICTMLVLE